MNLPLVSSSHQLAGAAILAVGIWVKVDSGSVLNFLGEIENAPEELSQVLNVGYLLIAIGALLVVIGFLGCCGAIRENKCMLLLVGVDSSSVHQGESSALSLNSSSKNRTDVSV